MRRRGCAFFYGIRKSAFVCAFMMFAFTEPAHAEKVIHGTAFDLESNKVAYIEIHRFPSDTRHKVIYAEPSGDVFARKELDYSSGKSTPGFTQTNMRLDEVIEVSHLSDGAISVRYAIEGKSAKEKTLKNADELVIDAGFNNYVLEHWDKLLEGSSLEFDYLLPTRQQRFRLKAERDDCKDEAATCFTIRPANGFFALLMKPLKLKYVDGLLAQFSGRSNIAQESGEYHQVRIEYVPLEIAMECADSEACVLTHARDSVSFQDGGGKSTVLARY